MAQVDRTMIDLYLRALFDGVEPADEDFVVFRGIGERGTQAITTAINVPVQVKHQRIVGVAWDCAQRWSQASLATFVVPGITTDAHAKLDSVHTLTAVLVDLDVGNIDAAMAHAITHLGVYPSFGVWTGGVTPEGQQKRHLYWLLREPSREVEKVVRARLLLAQKIGGDGKVAQAQQPIRVPGSIYGKNYVSHLVTMVGRLNEANALDISKFPRFELDELIARIEEMPPMPGVVYVEPGASIISMEERRSARVEALRGQVFEGGTPEHNRWESFNHVAAGYIREALRGAYSMDTAYQLTCGWVWHGMVPPWPVERIESEFQGLLAKIVISFQKDLAEGKERFVAASGFPPPPPPTAVALDGEVLVPNINFPVEGAAPPPPPPPRLRGMIVGDIADKPVPPMVWLVEGMIPAFTASLLASQGAVGKSLLLLKLGLILAGAYGPEGAVWLGVHVKPVEGMVYIVSAEDDEDEVQRRLHALATREQLKLVADNFRVLCLPNEGGAKPIVHHARKFLEATKEVVDINRPAAWWSETIEALKASGRKIAFVGLDTYSAMSHDDDAKMKTAREFIEQASTVCTDLGATLVISMHFRKHNDAGFKNAEEALLAVKGSNAMPNAARSVIVLYTPMDWRDRMRALGLKPVPNMLYQCAVPKSNRGGAAERTCVRDEATGVPEATKVPDRMRRWSVAFAISVSQAALHRVPMTLMGDRTGPDVHRERLHPDVRNLSRTLLRAVARVCIDQAMIVQVRLQGARGRGIEYLDVQNGPIAAGHFSRDDLVDGLVTYGFDRWRHWNEESESYDAPAFSLGSAAPAAGPSTNGEDDVPF